MTDPVPSSWLLAPRSLAHGLRRWPSWTRALLALGWMGMIWSLSSRQEVLPEGTDSPLWVFLANLAHAPLFGLLALWIGLAGLPRAPVAKERAGPIPALGLARSSCVWLAAVSYGALDEWHQSWVPGRDATVSDVLIDGLGAGLVLWIGAYLAQAEATGSGMRQRLLGGVGLCALCTWLLGS